jgi:hypothetical protein
MAIKKATKKLQVKVTRVKIRAKPVKVVIKSKPIKKEEMDLCKLPDNISEDRKIPDKGLKAIDNEQSNKGKFQKITQENLLKFGIPPTPAIFKGADDFFEKKMLKLKYLNEQMIDIYSRVFIYKISKAQCKKSIIFGGSIKKEIFNRALQEVDDWEMPVDKRQNEQVCNLYKIGD